VNYSEEIKKRIEWRKKHWIRWKYERLKSFFWERIIGIVYKHKCIQLIAGQKYYKFPEDFLLKYNDFLTEGTSPSGLCDFHIQYLPRWFGKCTRGFYVP